MSCPTPQQLQQFRQGQLSGPAKQQANAHVNQCPRCQQQLKTSSSSTNPAEASSLGGVVKEPTGPEDLRAGRILSECYTLERELGKGGMGSVWAARDNKLQRQVAIKMLSINVMGTTTMQDGPLTPSVTPEFCQFVSGDHVSDTLFSLQLSLSSPRLFRSLEHARRRSQQGNF